MSAKNTLRQAFASHSPVWGIFLGLWLAVGDIFLTPPDAGEFTSYVGLSKLLPMLVGVALFAVWTLLAFTNWETKGRRIAYGVALGATIVAVAVGGASNSSLYTSDQVPAWRFALLPGIALLAAGLGWLIRSRDEVRSRRMLLTGIVALGLIGYAQENAFAWSLVAAVAITYLWLIPKWKPFDAFTGLTIHALAVLAMVQAQPSWFGWTPFPFLTFFPLYGLILFLHGTEESRRGSWWVGVVVAGGSALLGLSTLVGNLRKALPWTESAIMLAIGIAFGVVYWFLRTRATIQTAPTAETA